MDRRRFMLALGGAAMVAGRARGADPLVPIPPFEALSRLEQKAGGRLGVAMLEGGANALVGYRAEERFALCSTFKFSLAAAVLARIDAGTLRASLPITIAERDILPNSPVTKAALPQGAMSVLALAQAAQVESDNAAANLLLRQIGGPEALTRFWRSLGDDASWLDRTEPDLNTTVAPDERDTTTPAVMARDMAAILTGDVLSPASRERLAGWTVASHTGLSRIRAGLPGGWRVGDKTGTFSLEGRGMRVNDIAALWRPDGVPCFITAYYEPRAGTPLPQAEAVLAEVGRIAARWMGA